MSLLGESLDYLRKYGLVRLLRKAPGRLRRTVRPLLFSAGLIKDDNEQIGSGIRCFYVPRLLPRLNLVMSDDDVIADNTDRLMCLILNLTDRTGYELRIMSDPPFNTLTFSRLLKSTGLQFGNVEFASISTGQSNSEIDIGPLDIFICSSPAALARIVDYVNASNIFQISAEQLTQSGGAEVLNRLSQQINLQISGLQSGGPHVHP